MELDLGRSEKECWTFNLDGVFTTILICLFVQPLILFSGSGMEGLLIRLKLSHLKRCLPQHLQNRKEMDFLFSNTFIRSSNTSIHVVTLQ